MKPRLAVIDLSFSWPPDGGARLDTYEVLKRLQEDFEVCLFAPSYTDYGFTRGNIQGKIDFPYQLVSVSREEYSSKILPQKFRKAVSEYTPNLIFFTDSWHMKPSVFLAFPEYKRILRFFAYETLCLKNYGLLYFKGHSCSKNYLQSLSDLAFCHFCTLSSTLKHKNKLFFHEYLSARCYRPLFYRRQVTAMLQSADLVICYNRIAEDRISRWNKNIQVTPSGVDCIQFPYQPYPQNNKKKIFMSGRVNDPLKGFVTLLEAGEKLFQKRTDFEILYTSPHPLSAEGKFTRHIPWVRHSELSHYYAQSDICVIPSLWQEPFGIVALEAFSTGRPVIASAVGGLRDIFTNHKEGYIFQPGNADELAHYLEDLLSSPQKAEMMGKKGRALVEDRYTWEKIYHHYYREQFLSLIK